MGIGATAKPTWVTARFGMPVLMRAGRNEVRAVYGGFGLFGLFDLRFVIVPPLLVIRVLWTKRGHAEMSP